MNSNNVTEVKITTASRCTRCSYSIPRDVVKKAYAQVKPAYWFRIESSGRNRRVLQQIFPMHQTSEGGCSAQIAPTKLISSVFEKCISEEV